MKQLSIFSFIPFDGENVDDLKQQVYIHFIKEKRNWEYAFQKWSNEQSQDGSNSCGCCGYGSMCDWCDDNTFGRPCVRALNAMLREKGRQIDYSKRNFEDVWYGGGT